MNDREMWRLVIDVGEILLNLTANGDDLLITYGDLARQLPYEFNPRNLDRPLGMLSNICKELDLPLISTIVINQDELRPGAGYFKYYFPRAKASQWDEIFIEQYNRVKEWRDWTPFTEELGLE